jgi:hypothetical protein
LQAVLRKLKNKLFENRSKDSNHKFSTSNIFVKFVKNKTIKWISY